MTTDSKTGGSRSGGWKRGLVALGLVAGIGLVQGCIIETSSGPPCLDSQLTFDWVVTQGGVSVACPPSTSVGIIIDDSTMMAKFPCAPHQATTDFVRGGITHRLSFFLLQDPAEDTLSSLENVPVPFGCGVNQGLGDTVEFSLTP